MKIKGRKSGIGPDILLICPDAQIGEASALALTLIRKWSHTYRIHVLFLSSDGTLMPMFRSQSVAIWKPERTTELSDFVSTAILETLKETSLAFAITISTKTRIAIQFLKKYKIPNLSIIMEFASQSPSLTAVRDVMTSADQVAMSSSIVLKDAIETDYLLNQGRNTHILPPVCLDLATDQYIRSSEIRQIQRNLKPLEGSQSQLIILGAGSITYNNGVDKFLEVARNLIRHIGKNNAYFIWLRPDINECDSGYSASILKQIRADGLENNVSILPNISNIHALLQISDIFLSTARLDPMSIYGFAAMRVGLPVLCLENLSSLKSFLSSIESKKTSVGKGSDIDNLTNKLNDLLDSHAQRTFFGARNASLAYHRLNINNYIQHIESIVSSCTSDDSDDIKFISESSYFNPDYCLPSEGNIDNRQAAAKFYINGMRTGVAIRKPEPGFNPLVFQHHHALNKDTDPYVHFLKRGRPVGPWLTQVIKGGKNITKSKKLKSNQLKIALHIHAYYPEQIYDIIFRIHQNTSKPDLFVSTSDYSSKSLLDQAFKNYSGQKVLTEIVPNVGRDIGPLLTGFGEKLVREYDIIGHVHTKKTVHVEDRKSVEEWKEFNLSGVLGGELAGPMMDEIISEFHRNDQLGVVYPDDPNVFGWTSNKDSASKILSLLNITYFPEAINFPVGNMFWMRSEALQSFVDLGLQWRDYPIEPLANDGTMLHALERLFGVVPQLQGWSTAVTYTPGVVRG